MFLSYNFFYELAINMMIQPRSKLLQSLAGRQGSQQSAAKSGWAPGIAASCCKVWLGGRDRSKPLQSLAGRQESQQAAAKSGGAPGIAASCCKAWLGARDRSKLLQSPPGRQGSQQSAAKPGWAPGIAASCCLGLNTQYLQEACVTAPAQLVP